MDIVDIARRRYTAKHYDPSRRISREDMERLREVLRLCPFSVNSQPWHFFIASTPEAKARILPAILDFNRERVELASDVVVIAVRDRIDEDYFRDLMAQEVSDGRFSREEARAGQDAGRRHFVGLHNTSADDLYAWTSRQGYIAMGFLLFSAAAIGIDSTPIEGFDYALMDEILGLKGKGLRSAVAVSLGYRADHDANATRPKSRWSAGRVFTEL